MTSTIAPHHMPLLFPYLSQGNWPLHATLAFRHGSQAVPRARRAILLLLLPKDCCGGPTHSAIASSGSIGERLGEATTANVRRLVVCLDRRPSCAAMRKVLCAMGDTRGSFSQSVARAFAGRTRRTLTLTLSIGT